MNILLISQNQEKVPYPVLPVGLCYVAEALEAAGHRVSVVDLCFARDVRRAVAAEPDVVAGRLRTLWGMRA